MDRNSNKYKYLNGFNNFPNLNGAAFVNDRFIPTEQDQQTQRQVYNTIQHNNNLFGNQPTEISQYNNKLQEELLDN